MNLSKQISQEHWSSFKDNAFKAQPLRKEINLADVEKIVDRYLNLKQKASKQTESNKELLEQVNCFFNILKNLTNKYNENERENRSLKRRFLYWKNKFKNNY